MTTGATAFWEDFYRDRDVWSGRPNPLLVDEAAGLAPGTALDLGAGQGGDAIWLAQLGWRVTAVDVSGEALAFAADRAAAAGVADAITWVQADLPAGFPPGEFDLVSAAYLHAPPGVPLDRDAVLRAAIAAVAPGGALVVVGHEHTPWLDHAHHELHLPSPAEVLEDLAIPPSWAVRRSESVEREATDPEGRPTTRRDGVLHVTRPR